MEASERDRRRSFRIEVGATACIWDRGRFRGGYPVADLSLGGCCLEDGPDCDVGQQLELSLHLLDLQRDLHLPVRVVRRSGQSLGLRFMSHNPGVEDCIHDLLMQCLEEDISRHGQVILMHPRPEEVAGLLESLEEQGTQVHLATTPLQMVWMLENKASEIQAAVVSHHLGLADGLDVVAFLAGRYPHIKRLLLPNRDEEPASVPLGHAHGVLRTPFDLTGPRKTTPGRRNKRGAA